METKIEKLSPKSALVVNKIEDWQKNSMEFLSFREKLTLCNISNTVKKNEWVAARFALKQSLECFDLSYPGFYKDEFGKSHPMENIGHVSLSHTKGFVAAIYHENLPVGVDIERVQEKIIKIGPKFLSPRELEICNNDPILLTMAWSSKEAAYKIYGKKGISLKDNIQIIEDDLKSNIWNLEIITELNKIKHYPIQIEVMNDIVLSYSKW